jgi:hypothetical protein
MVQFSHFSRLSPKKNQNFFNKFTLQLKLLQAVGLTGAYVGKRGKFINNVVKCGKMWFKFQYI